LSFCNVILWPKEPENQSKRSLARKPPQGAVTRPDASCHLMLLSEISALRDLRCIAFKEKLTAYSTSCPRCLPEFQRHCVVILTVPEGFLRLLLQ
jgi:hypothetical protein